MTLCRKLLLVWIIAICTCALLGGCRGHVNLGPLPSKEAPLAERIEAYKQYRVEKETSNVLFVNYAPVSVVKDHILLGDGTRVDHPEDLIQLVGPSSKLAGYVDSANRNNLMAQGFGWGGVGLSGAGVGLVFSSMGDARRPFGEAPPVPFLGLSLILVGGISMLVSILFFGNEGRERGSAFDVYDGDLLRSLSLQKADFKF